MSSSTVIPLRPLARPGESSSLPGESFEDQPAASQFQGSQSCRPQAGALSATLSAAQLARLTAWRELHVRWPLHLVMGFVLALTWVLPERYEAGAGFFALIGVVLYAFALALGGRSREDSFWVGLGGPPAVREATTTLVQFGVVGLSLLLTRGADDFQVVEAARICAVTLALGGFARAFARSWAGRLGVATSTLLLSAATLLPSYWIAKWPLIMAAQWRLVVMVVGAVALRLLWARRHPATAAWRGARRFEWMLLPLASGLVSVVELAWNQPVGDHEFSRVGGASFHAPQNPDPVGEAQRVWRKDGDGWTALPLRGVLGEVVTQESGAMAFEVTELDWNSRQAGLLTPDGEKLSCPASAFVRDWWLDAGGRGGTALLADGSLLVVDLDEGCGSALEVPEGLPDIYVQINEQRAAEGRPLYRAGDVPGTVICPRRDGTERVLDLATGQYL